ncbi:hypothetical protein B9479_007219 [Cryptococcus floricola]|uniref:Acid phosphatase n=1 Tax=Cryptococcus floricola TaxID=2591691 RepID=A0A5D3AMU5_9TREE|nr:hypothetical protein B9479_007219 [Cryptococcus floricola]
MRSSSLAVVGAFTSLVSGLANAAVIEVRADDSGAGSTTSDVFPPNGTQVNSQLFPPESQVGYAGPTPTGVEPGAAATAAIYASNTGATGNFPLVVEDPLEESDSDFDVFKHWGNLSPWYSVPSSDFGLNDTSPLVPVNCSITQVHIIYRHGARYPTSGAAPTLFAEKLANATNLTAEGELGFLNGWTYKLGAELLSPFGRLQEFSLGLANRQQYGILLNNFTEQGTLPVFRTESQDRMVKTTANFAAGFFGVPEYLDEVNIELMVEADGVNNTGAPYSICTNANNFRGKLGSTAAAQFAQNAFNGTLDRLQGQLSGLELDSEDIIAMLQLCAYETVTLGYSVFCKVFTEEDFKNFEYYYDLTFYYEQGFGSPVAAAQGKGFLEEYVARFTQTPITTSDSALNSTLDSDPTYFPLNQSIYADATHEVVVLDFLSALNLTALYSTGPLPVDRRVENSSFVASKVVPFATHLVAQVVECLDLVPTKQIRFILNDAVVPIHDSYEGCEWNKDGLCAFDTVVSALQKRIEEIDFAYDCFGNYTVEVGKDYNGRAPRE